MATRGQVWPRSGRGSSSPQSLVLTTGVLATHAEALLHPTLTGTGWQFTAAAATGPCRVRLYASDAARTTDAKRPSGATPYTLDALIFEGIFAADLLSFAVQPAAAGVGAVYAAIENLSNPTSITVTITYVPIEG